MKIYDSLEHAIGNKIISRSRIYGGDINDAWRLQLFDGSQLFMKTNRYSNVDFFAKEAQGLSLLRKTRCIGVPEVYGYGRDQEENISFLLMEYIQTQGRNPDYWETFGRELAMMHRAAIEHEAFEGGQRSGLEPVDTACLRYGLFQDNYIGSNPQYNQPAGSWITFYRECRLLPQIRMADAYLDLEMKKKLDWLLSHLDQYLREPEFPSLLHGDLWNGNAMAGNDGKAWLIDPAVYVGDFETDIAMTQLFGGFPSTFYGAYHEVNPFSPEYKERRPIYDLYHMLNHLNLFGRGYLREVWEILNVLVSDTSWCLTPIRDTNT